MFKSLPVLTDLDLRGNKISILPSNSFVKLISLKTLHLEYNLITVIKENAFNGLKRLVNLHLNNNIIMFNSIVNKSKELDSSNNTSRFKFLIQKFSYLETNYINQMNSLTHTTSKPHYQLNNHNYFIKNADALHLSNFNDLKFLDLSSNPLFILNKSDSPFSNQFKSFNDQSTSASAVNKSSELKNHNTSLDTLLLNNCSLFKFEADSLSLLNNLVNLDMSDNLVSVSI